MSESYPNNSTKIGDKYSLKTGKKYRIRDVMVVTGSVVGDRAEIDKMGASYLSKDVIGIMENEVDLRTNNDSIFLPYPYQEATILVEGASSAIVAEAVKANDLLQGASDQITQTFSGDNTAQQTVNVGNVPIDSVVSFIEATPTTLTRVTGVPSTNEYSLNDVTGKLIIGGTSVSGTDNYTLIFNVDSGRLEKLVEEKAESIVVTTHVGAAVSEPIDQILSVVSTAGTLTGALIPIYSGTPITGEVSVNRATGVTTFAAADAVTAADLVYKTSNKACARALENKSAGEICNIFFKGVD